jgi:hypothetical protein
MDLSTSIASEVPTGYFTLPHSLPHLHHAAALQHLVLPLMHAPHWGGQQYLPAPSLLAWQSSAGWQEAGCHHQGSGYLLRLLVRSPGCAAAHLLPPELLQPPQQLLQLLLQAPAALLRSYASASRAASACLLSRKAGRTVSISASTTKHMARMHAFMCQLPRRCA